MLRVGLELLNQNVLPGALPLHEVEDVLLLVRSGASREALVLDDLCSGGGGEVGAILDCYHEGLLRRDQAGLLDPGAALPQAMGAIVFAVLRLDGGMWCDLPQPAPVVHRRLALNLPTDVVLIDVGGNLARSVHQVIVGARPLEEGALVPVPLPVGGHHLRALNLRGGQDVRGELVDHGQDAGPEDLPDLFLVGTRVLFRDLSGGLDPVDVAV